MATLSIPIETDPRGYWLDKLVEFTSYADCIRNAYPEQYFEIPGAVILQLDSEYELPCPISS